MSVYYDIDMLNVKAKRFLREMKAYAIEDDLEMITCCEYGCYNEVPIMDINDTREKLMVDSSGRVYMCVPHKDVLERIVSSVAEMLKNTQKRDAGPILFNDEIDLTVKGRSVCKDAYIRIVRISMEKLEQVYVAVKNPCKPLCFNSEHVWWSESVYEHTYMNDEIRGFPCCNLQCYDKLAIREIVEARASLMDTYGCKFEKLSKKIVDSLYENTVNMDEVDTVLDYGYINYRINGKRLCYDAYCYTMGLDAGDNFDNVYGRLVERLLILYEANVFFENMDTYMTSLNL